MRLLFVAGASLVLPALAAAGPQPAPKRTEIAKGVYLFQTAPYGDLGLDGNSVAIVSPQGVLVFDANGTPAAAAAVLDEIRALTAAPVRYVVYSHWHWDHWYGTQVYKAAFPAVQVIAHAATRELMAGPALEFNRPGLEQQLPAYIRALEEKAASDASLKPRLDAARSFLEQKRSVRHVLPDVTFRARLDLALGERRIELRHPGRAVTPGDVVLLLPDERILVTGDLLVNPIPFALSVYPTEWLRALEALDALDPAVIVPGHGDPLKDESLLHATIEVFRVLLREGAAAKRKGQSVAQATEAALPAVAGLAQRFTGGDPALDRQFRLYVVKWFLHRVYDELDGPLDDTIAPIPPD